MSELHGAARGEQATHTRPPPAHLPRTATTGASASTSAGNAGAGRAPRRGGQPGAQVQEFCISRKTQMQSLCTLSGGHRFWAYSRERHRVPRGNFSQAAAEIPHLEKRNSAGGLHLRKNCALRAQKKPGGPAASPPAQSTRKTGGAAAHRSAKTRTTGGFAAQNQKDRRQAAQNQNDRRQAAQNQNDRRHAARADEPHPAPQRAARGHAQARTTQGHRAPAIREAGAGSKTRPAARVFHLEL